MRRLFNLILFLFLLVVIVTAGGYLSIRNTIKNQTDGYIYSDYSKLPTNTVAMVLGAQVLPGSIPSRALAYRLSTAIHLYKDGKVTTLLMSGDGRSPYYNEVKTMQEYATANQVPDSDILLDEGGLRTYTSCYRAKNEFKLTKVTIVTQPEHLLRTVYTCRSLGLDAIGIEAPELSGGEIHNSELWQYKIREKAALVLAWIDINVLKPSP